MHLGETAAERAREQHAAHGAARCEHQGRAHFAVQRHVPQRRRQLDVPRRAQLDAQIADGKRHAHAARRGRRASGGRCRRTLPLRLGAQRVVVDAHCAAQRKRLRRAAVAEPRVEQLAQLVGVPAAEHAHVAHILAVWPAKLAKRDRVHCAAGRARASVANAYTETRAASPGSTHLPTAGCTSSSRSAGCRSDSLGVQRDVHVCSARRTLCREPATSSDVAASTRYSSAGSAAPPLLFSFDSIKRL